ncbi:MAG: segregation/condensation protein A [Chloroflexota bacterium]
MSILADIDDALNPEGEKNKYQVSLSDFYGPMDLLLALIEREELEITGIALAQITDQYLAYLTALKEISPDNLTDFLAVASKLILIKSRVLLPKPPVSIISDEEEHDVDDLVQQLRDYKRFKQLAQDMQKIEQKGHRHFIRLTTPLKVEPKLRPGEADVSKLLLAVRRALTVRPPQPDVDHVVSRQEITIGQQISMIRTRFQTDTQIPFEALLDNSQSRVTVIVTLLAVLELLKLRYIDIDQNEDFGDITLIKRTDRDVEAEDWEGLVSLTELS